MPLIFFSKTVYGIHIKLSAIFYDQKQFWCRSLCVI